MKIKIKITDEMKFKVKIGSSGGESGGGNKPVSLYFVNTLAAQPVLAHLTVVEEE